MSDYLFYLLIALALFLVEIFYFPLANRFGIVDRPNHRSSHQNLTIRGGGIIFPIAIILYSIFNGFAYPLFISGLIIISVISFFDDLKPLSRIIRLTGHLVAVTLLFFETGLEGYAFWILALVGVLVVGTINAYNFMDGINGITGAYSFITFLSLYYINYSIIGFINEEILMVSIIAIIIFNYYNFRKIAKCFAGDVGSVSIAFVIIFFIMMLIIKSNDFKYIGLLLLYGLDSATTIMFRLVRKENIFEAHRSHLYQFLANEKGLPHLGVSGLYLFIQLLINLFIVKSNLDIFNFVIVLMIMGVLFVGVRFLTEGKLKLIGNAKAPLN